MQSSQLILALVALILGVAQAFTGAFAPFSGAVRRSSVAGGLRMAHHVQFKGAKKARKNRPRKSCPSDINRKAPSYNPDTMAESDMSKYTKLERNGETFYHVKAPHTAA